MRRFHGVSAVILAGGRGRRMGIEDKALLEIAGESFLHRIRRQISGMFDEVLLSVDDGGRFGHCDLRRVEDKYPDSGALGGILSSLYTCGGGSVFVVACDMPLFDGGLAEYICNLNGFGLDAVLPVTRDGKIHPVCGVYNKTAVPVMERRLSARRMSMMGLIDELRVHKAELSQTDFHDDLLTNVNTPEELAELRQKFKNI